MKNKEDYVDQIVIYAKEKKKKTRKKIKRSLKTEMCTFM